MRCLINFLLVMVVIASGCRSLRRDPIAADDYADSLSAKTGETPASGDVRRVNFEEEEDGKLGIDDLAPDRLGKTFKKVAGQGPNQKIADQRLQEAEAAYAEAMRDHENEATREQAKTGFAKAGDRYMAAAQRYPDSSLEHDALFQAGEAYFFADSYTKSNAAFEQLIDKYPGTRYLDRVEARRFAIARFWLELDEYAPDNFFSYNLTDKKRPSRDTDGNAIRILNKIRLDDPSGRLADDATMALGNAYFTDGRYLDAADTYSDLRKAFPGSTHVFNANLLEIRSRLESYRGPEYDGTGLEAAERLMKSVVAQFPNKVEENHDYLDEMAGEIRFRLAEREMNLAQHYDRRKEFRAARLHYQKVANDFSDTALAEPAQQRLDEILEEPDLPPQRLKFLVDVLPKPKDQKPLFNNDVPR